jgi:hypothetical protein
MIRGYFKSLCKNSQKMTYANLRPTASALLLLLGVSSAAALTLERSPSFVLLGRPLEFNIQATVSEGEKISALCLEADVFQSDTPVNPNRVNVQLLKTGNSNLFTLRVSSSLIVEEPILTVVVRHGCLLKNSRRYVVFANPPAIAGESVSASSGNPAFVPPPATQLAAIKGSSGTNAEASTAIKSASNKKATPIDSTGLVQTRQSGLSTPIKNSKSRLRLEAIDLNVEPITRLKSTLELLVVPSELSSTRRVEAAAMWRVINAQSEDLRQDIQRLTALETETTALRETSSKSNAEFARISSQLKDVEKSRYQNPLVYGLTAILVLLLANLAFMRFGLKTDDVKTMWWKPRRSKSGQRDERTMTVLKEASIAKSDVQQRESTIPFKTKSVAWIGESHETDLLAGQLKFKSSESAYAMLSVYGNARGVNVEELFDIQQQADFFTSLGQHDQAIDVLQNHIRENVQTSPLVYLDLIKLYHRKDRRTDYQDLTNEFTRIFNADMPEFEAFHNKTRGLETYEGTLTQITLVWHTDKVLKTIENSVFREEGRISEALGLEAYTELLLLHSIATDLLENQAIRNDFNDQFLLPKTELSTSAALIDDLSPPNFHQTIPQKLKPVVNMNSRDNIYGDISSSSFQKPVGARIGLDIDLTVDCLGAEAGKSFIAGEKNKPEETDLVSTNEIIQFDLESFGATKSARSL